MTTRTTDRRAFLKAGAVLAPIVAAPAAAAVAAEPRSRLADEAAIAAAHRAWLRAEGQGVRLDSHVEPEIALAADHATARYACTVAVETALAPDSTFAQMALLQGGGRTITHEPRTLVARYERAGEGWRVARFELLRL